MPPPALPWLKTTAQVDVGMKIAQDQFDRERQVAMRKGKEVKEKERNKTKGLLKINQNEQRKRDAHRDREMKKEVLIAEHVREMKVEVRKQKEIKDRLLERSQMSHIGRVSEKVKLQKGGRDNL